MSRLSVPAPWMTASHNNELAWNQISYVSNAVIPQDFLDAIAQEHHLSKAEREVLFLAMDGKSTAAIAQDLGISGDAVRKRLSEVYQKFQISGRGPVKLTRLQQLLVSRYQEQPQMQSPSSGETAPLPIVEDSPVPVAPAHYWGEAPDSAVFYGREAELTKLRHWLLEDRCRLVTVLGMAGIGKTALAVKLARQLQNEFGFIIWFSLRQAPSLGEVLRQANHVLTKGTNFSYDGKPYPEDWEQPLSALLTHFRNRRGLLVLDGAESILQSGRLAGIYREGYGDYGKLFQRVGQESHQSCVLVTSQEKPAEISLLEGETSPVRSLTLGGLREADAQQLLIEKGVTGDPQKWADLIRGYRGNPFMLKMVATTIREVFDGNVTTFLKTTLFTHDISDYIEDILDRVSEVEEEVLHQIALKQQPMTMDELIAALPDASPQDLIQALQSLKQRSLLETSEGRFNLPPTVMTILAQNLES
ncbi:MAG: LuxR C-terminal-related transcriptional regulator [Synechococcales bacterium]|nr:LuxR C-terminal-related transcriptional regulator [Synechococcales bacterium]